MSSLVVPNAIVNGAALDASKVDQNFTTIQSYVNTNAIVKDGTVQMTGDLLLKAGVNPTLADHAARKAYVDSYFPVALANLAANSVDASKIVDGTITNAEIAAGAAIAYSKLALTGSVTNADIAAGAGIVYSKLNLAGSVANADIAAGAAIAYSKLNLSGSVLRSDFSAAAGELNSSWQDVSCTFANATSPVYNCKGLKLGNKTWAIRFYMVSGTATAANVVTVNMGGLGANFVGAGNYAVFGQGPLGAVTLFRIVVGTGGLWMTANSNGANFSAGADLSGYSFTAVLETS